MWHVLYMDMQMNVHKYRLHPVAKRARDLFVSLILLFYVCSKIPYLLWKTSKLGVCVAVNLSFSSICFSFFHCLHHPLNFSLFFLSFVLCLTLFSLLSENKHIYIRISIFTHSHGSCPLFCNSWHILQQRNFLVLSLPLPLAFVEHALLYTPLILSSCMMRERA